MGYSVGVKEGTAVGGAVMGISGTSSSSGSSKWSARSSSAANKKGAWSKRAAIEKKIDNFILFGVGTRQFVYKCKRQVASGKKCLFLQ